MIAYIIFRGFVGVFSIPARIFVRCGWKGRTAMVGMAVACLIIGVVSAHSGGTATA